jgi:hypothetical protein
MPWMRALVLAVIGLALPVGLALAVYASSAGALAATPVVTPITGQLATPSKQPAPPTTSTQGTTTEGTTTTETEDRSGSDDRDGDNSGPGSDDSGSGSDDSGHGGGDD